MNQKGFANIILVIAVVLSIGVAGYFSFVKKSEPTTQQPTLTPVTSQIKIPTSILTPKDEIINWKTYRNEHYGFEIKYPKELKYSISPAEFFIIQFYIDLDNSYDVKENKFTGSKLVFSIGACDSESNIRPCSEHLKHDNKEWQDKGRVIIDNVIAQKISRPIIPGASVMENTAYLISTKNIVITFNNSVSNFNFKDFDQILSTFSFLKQTVPTSTNNAPKQTPQSSETTNWSSYKHLYYDVTLFYPLDWKTSFDYSESDPLFFTSADYQKNKSGASVNFIFALTTDNRFNWQGTVAAMYGSNSKNELTQINGKTMLRTTYSDQKIEAVSIPIANGKAFVSLFLKSQLSTKDKYTSIFYEMVKRVQLPNTLSDTWQTYRNAEYGFTFTHPPFTEVKESSQQNLLVFVRYGFHQSLSVNSKSPSESLYMWYTKRLEPGELERKRVVEKKISGYDGLEITEEVMASIIHTTFLAKDNLVVGFTNEGLASLDNALPADNQRLIESFRFR